MCLTMIWRTQVSQFAGLDLEIAYTRASFSEKPVTSSKSVWYNLVVDDRCSS